MNIKSKFFTAGEALRVVQNLSTLVDKGQVGNTVPGSKSSPSQITPENLELTKTGPRVNKMFGSTKNGSVSPEGISGESYVYKRTASDRKKVIIILAVIVIILLGLFLLFMLLYLLQNTQFNAYKNSNNANSLANASCNSTTTLILPW
jgi:hypothetical protein